MASVLDRLRLDVAVLTEPPAALPVSAGGVVASPAGRVSGDRLEAWVAIVGAHFEPIDVELPYTRLAVAAHVRTPGHPLVVYDSVLPWRAPPPISCQSSPCPQSQRRTCSSAS